MKVFVGFVLISGVGWLLDFSSYSALTQLFGIVSSKSNFISSMVGVTYVWIVALNRLFRRKNDGVPVYLMIYWAYQAASISGYSLLISVVAASAPNLWMSVVLGMPAALVAKIVLTPVNLLTNFMFMSFLTKFMKTSTQGQQLQ
jgi:putative flippase GtrA